MAEAELLERLFPDDSAPRALALIWATVDLGRAVADFRLAAEDLAPDPLLGATGRLVRPPDGAAVALLEPTTEGRLAATLARFGEGLAGRYVEAPIERRGLEARVAAAGLRLGRSAQGPFGRSVLVLGGPVEGPHLVIVARPAGTIGR